MLFNACWLISVSLDLLLNHDALSLIMTNKISRSLLAASAAVLAFAGLLHATAFNKAASAVASSNLPVLYANVLKAFWLMNSTTLIVLAVTLGLIAIRPSAATGSVIVLLALIPAAIAALLYTFMGMFIPAHLLLAAAVLALFAGLLRARNV
jgi:hypothetical protein